MNREAAERRSRIYNSLALTMPDSIMTHSTTAIDPTTGDLLVTTFKRLRFGGVEHSRYLATMQGPEAEALRAKAEVNLERDPLVWARCPVTGLPRPPKVETNDEMLQVRNIATAAAIAVLDKLEPRSEGQPPHEVRVHMPGHGMLRLLVAPDIADDVLAEVEAEVDDKVDGLVATLGVEREPGDLPEGQGYVIKEGVDSNGEAGDGVHPGTAPSAEWMVYHWENAELDDAGQGRRSKAEAIDDVWCDYNALVGDDVTARMTEE